MPHGVVYIVGSDTGTLYIGVTSNLCRRILQHKNGNGSAFTSKYKCHRLLYCELFDDILQAIAREKVLKGKSRGKKVVLIRTMNPDFLDLAEHWGWLAIGPYRTMEEVDAELRSRVQLSLPAHKSSGGKRPSSLANPMR